MSLQTMAHFLKLKFSWLLPKCPCEADNFYLHTPLLQIFFCTPPSPPNQPRLSQALSFQFSSVTQSWLTQHVMNCSMPGLPAQYQLPESTQTHIHRSVMPSNYLILCCPFFSCPQSFPASESFPMSCLFASGGQNIGVSASTSVFQWTTGLISFRMDWLDLLAVQGTLKNLL